MIRSFLLLAALLAGPASAQVWVPVGPPGGDVRSLAADPRDPRGSTSAPPTACSTARRTRGRSWQRLSPASPSAGRASTTSWWTRDGVVLVGYWEVRGHGGGVARSTDGGQTFTLLPGIDGPGGARAGPVGRLDPERAGGGHPHRRLPLRRRRAAPGGASAPRDTSTSGTSARWPSIPRTPASSTRAPGTCPGRRPTAAAPGTRSPRA